MATNTEKEIVIYLDEATESTEKEVASNIEEVVSQTEKEVAPNIEKVVSQIDREVAANIEEVVSHAEKEVATNVEKVAKNFDELVANSYEEMEANARAILKKLCPTPPPVLRRPRRYNIKRETIRDKTPPPITKVITVRCPTPEQDVIARVRFCETLCVFVN